MPSFSVVVRVFGFRGVESRAGRSKTVSGTFPGAVPGKVRRNRRTAKQERMGSSSRSRQVAARSPLQRRSRDL
jgi:hypothetical protein